MKQIEDMEQKNIILYMDKIIYPDTVKPIIDRLNMYKPKNCDMKFIAITPQNSPGF